MRARTLALLVLLGCSLAAIGQSFAPPVVKRRSVAKETRIEPVAAAPVPSRRTAATDPELKIVVALFRHGVRAPLNDLNDPRKEQHSQSPWPTQADWGVQKWGDLTPHGVRLVQALGRDYAQTYRKLWGTGFKAFLWADNEDRTRTTANALAAGFNELQISAIVDDRKQGVDPLFHPFQALCGAPSAKWLQAISANISVNSQLWIHSKYAVPFQQLYDVLACTDTTKCVPLKNVTGNSAGYCTYPPGCGSASITWKGQFPYANTASETFLLEYATNMDTGKIGWGRVLAPPPNDTVKLLKMIRLHEFYFDQTQRDTYVSTIEASNLIREIRQTLNGANAPCQRISPDYKFAAFVGHDTNIAGVASLLNLSWQFTTAPDGTSGLPDNDPLPAGALIFQLWQGENGSFVRIEYAAQGLREMRTFSSGSCPAFHLPVRCDEYTVRPNVCEIPLKTFNDIVVRATGQDFLSACVDGKQVCSIPPAADRKKRGKNG